MNNHDRELTLYNNIANRLDQIDGILLKVLSHPSHRKASKVLQDGVHLSLVYLSEVKDAFRKYGELKSSE